MLSQLKAHAWQLAALALAVLLLQQFSARHAAELDAERARSQLATDRAAAERGGRLQSEDFRHREHRIANAQEKTEAAGRGELLAARADADRARAAADRVRRDLATYIEQHRERALAAAADSPAAGQCAADSAAALDLLADLRNRADDRAGELAQTADEARIRGLTCERAYDDARAALSAAHAETP
ncbi:DUF2514 family protein [Paracidovorax citrulli]|uniref:DUF2514 family protein n=1 Tax=Paracidovorax citrulli TaxID=80869 RepID=UPI0005FBF872|nr:DUF2514 family protein [Paracidovorax citrulli]